MECQKWNGLQLVNFTHKKGRVNWVFGLFFCCKICCPIGFQIKKSEEVWLDPQQILPNDQTWECIWGWCCGKRYWYIVSQMGLLWSYHPRFVSFTTAGDERQSWWGHHVALCLLQQVVSLKKRRVYSGGSFMFVLARCFRNVSDSF